MQWAEQHGAPFGPADIVKAVGVDRNTAAVLLATLLARGNSPLRRLRHGVYAHDNVASGTPFRMPRRKGGLVPRLFAWAKKRGRPFKATEAGKHLGIDPRHATTILSTLRDDDPMHRLARGVYQYAEQPHDLPNEGTQRARVLAWAGTRPRRRFGVVDIAAVLQTTRTRAQHVLNDLTGSPLPVRRVDRGRYQYGSQR